MQSGSFGTAVEVELFDDLLTAGRNLLLQVRSNVEFGQRRIEDGVRALEIAAGVVGRVVRVTPRVFAAQILDDLLDLLIVDAWHRFHKARQLVLEGHQLRWFDTLAVLVLAFGGAR